METFLSKILYPAKMLQNTFTSKLVQVQTSLGTN